MLDHDSSRNMPDKDLSTNIPDIQLNHQNTSQVQAKSQISQNNLLDWETLRDECSQEHGKFIKIPKQNISPFPPDFHISNMGLSKGAIRQYRDRRATQSLHIHEFPDYYLVHVDAFNPEDHPIAHGMMDTPGIFATVVLSAIGIYFASEALENWSITPQEDEDDSED